jgi:hypothetical protein
VKLAEVVAQQHIDAQERSFLSMNLADSVRVVPDIFPISALV